MASPERLTIAMMQRKLPTPELAASSYEDFYNLLAQLMAAELQLYNSVPVKCSVVGEKSRVFPESEEGMNVFALAANSDKLRIWYDAERRFDYLLCELCLGGTGTPEPEEDGVRPPSKFERRFKQNVLRKLLALIPTAAKRTSNVELDVAFENEDEIDAFPEKLAGRACVEVKFQVNVFALTAEITLLFLESELAKCLGGRVGAVGAGTATAAQALNDCRFAVEAYLKPRQITLDQVFNLEVGQVIPLSVGITEPVMLSCENKPVFQATINLHGGNVQLSLISEILESRRKTDVAA